MLEHILREEAADGADGAGSGSADDNLGGADNQGAQLSSENWKEFISEDLRGHEGLAKFTDLSSLAKSYINAESMIGKDKMVIPKTDEDFNFVYKTLGRPDSADGYEIDYGKNDDGTTRDGKDIFNTGFRDISHKLGLSSTQAIELHKWHTGVAADMDKQMNTDNQDEKNAAELALKNDLGERYKGSVVAAKRLIQDHGSEEFLDFLVDSKLGNDPRMTRFLVNIATHMGEDNLELGDDTGTQTNEQIQVEIDEVMALPAYLNKEDPTHDNTVKRVSRLHERLYAA